MKPYLFLFLSIFLSCGPDGTLIDNAETVWCPNASQYLTESQCESLYIQLDSMLCINKPFGIKGGFVPADKYIVNPALKIAWYRYNIKGDNISNCDFKFLEYVDFQADSVELCRWIYHNVGTAGYKIISKIPVGNDKYEYWCQQWRETFHGQINPNGLCNGGNMPQLPYDYVRYIGCGAYNYGDSLGLKKVVYN